MRWRLLAAATFLMMVFSGCQKDWAEDWIGTYTGTAGSTVNRIVVSKVNNKTLKMELQTIYLGGYVTFATVADAKLSNETTATVSEDGMIVGYSDPYYFSGSATRNGSSISLTGQAQNKNSSSDIKYYVFTGSK
jgi:hypothetical protein